jgi:hypothetical protein
MMCLTILMTAQMVKDVSVVAAAQWSPQIWIHL